MGPTLTTPTRMKTKFGPFKVEVVNHWDKANRDLIPVLEFYNGYEGAPDLIVTVRHSYRADDSHEDFAARYGWFYNASWSMSRIPRVTLSVNRSSLRIVRPLVDYEMHRLHEDVARIIHERIFTTFVQLTQAHACTFVHGAAMVTPSGRGILVAGVGGVGKTSLALEMGRRHGWLFLSDDLTLLDAEGVMHLNANRPKIYAYNVIGDHDLEQAILEERSPINRLHWVLKKPWPDRVRRSVLPRALYRVADSAPLSLMLIIERADVPEIEVTPVTPSDASDETIQTLEDELHGIRGSVESYLAHGRDAAERHTWSTSVWRSTLLRAIESATLLRVAVPEPMTASQYRTEMVPILREIEQL